FAGDPTVPSSERARLSVVLCDDQRDGRPLHRVSLVGNDGDQRFETASSDMGVVAETVARVASILDLPVSHGARLLRSNATDNLLPFVPAASVRPGMFMVDETGEPDEVLDVETINIDEPVYDIDVDRTHNFVANGIITHNSIYKFRGADFRNLLKFEESFPEAVTVVLDQNYRSSQRILDAANAVIRNNASHRPKH